VKLSNVWERGLQNYDDCRTNFYTLDTLRMLQQCQSSDELSNNRNIKQWIQRDHSNQIKTKHQACKTINVCNRVNCNDYLNFSHALIRLLTHVVKRRDSLQ